MKALKNWKNYLEEAIIRGIINSIVVSTMTFIITKIILQQQPHATSLKSQVTVLIIQKLVVWIIVKIIEIKSRSSA